MAGLLQLLGITCIRWSGVVIYAKNDKESLPAVDRQLQAEFEGFKRTLLFFSPAERKVLRACGTDERMVALNAMSR